MEQEKEPKKLSRPELDELVKRLNRLVGLTSIIVLIALFQIMVPSYLEQLTSAAQEKDRMITPQSANGEEISDTLVVNGIHMRTGLVVDTGFVQVKANCLACHSSRLITQNKATKDGWAHTIVWMQETQKLWDLGSNEEVIINYLAKHYAPEESGRRKQLQDIEWYDYNN
jgi:hypothetical protein